MERDRIIKESKAILPYAVRLREQFHRNPELAFREYATSALIEQELNKEGIPYSKVGDTGIVAVIRGKNAGKGNVLAIRTDMDALPIREETKEAFSSCNANMHACGHDLHMAMVLAAGVLTNRRKEQIGGTVKLIFQPAEEIGQGAQAIIRSGLIEDADTILALHMDPQEDTGIFRTGYGARTSSGCCISIVLEGESGQLFPAAALLIHLIAGQIPELLKTEYPYAFSPTIMRSLDESHLKLFYDGRIFTSEDDRQIEEIVRRIVSAVSGLYPVKARIQTERIGGAVINHRGSTGRAMQIVSELFGEKSVKITAPNMFGEDFRCYSEVTERLVFMTLGGACETKEYPLHNCKVRFSNHALLYGIAYYLGYVEEYLSQGQKE